MPAEALVRFDLSDQRQTAQVIAEPNLAVSESARSAVRAHVGRLAPGAVSERMAIGLRRQLFERAAMNMAS
jgi:hypothetical protein